MGKGIRTAIQCSILLLFSCKSTVIAQNGAVACNENMAVDIAKNSIRQTSTVNALSYSALRSGGEFIVTGNFIGPAIGFAPTIYVTISSCSVRSIEWR